MQMVSNLQTYREKVMEWVSWSASVFDLLVWVSNRISDFISFLTAWLAFQSSSLTPIKGHETLYTGVCVKTTVTFPCYTLNMSGIPTPKPTDRTPKDEANG